MVDHEFSALIPSGCFTMGGDLLSLRGAKMHTVWNHGSKRCQWAESGQ